MKWLTSFLIAVLTGVLGLVSAGFVASAYASWYHVSQREGAAGFFVIGLALLGGIAGFLIGLITSRLIGGSSFWKALGGASGMVLGSAGLAALMCYWLADIPPTIDSDELMLEVEIRLPAGHAKPEAAEPQLTLGSVVNHTQRASQTGELKINEARLENGRWIIPGEVLLFTSRGLRSMSAQLGDEEIAGFLVPLPARPDKQSEQWSEWGPRPPAGAPPWPDTKSSYRFRVRRIPPPPPPPTMEEYEAQQEVEAQAKFESIAPDAPIGVWIPYTHAGMNESRRAAALHHITSRPGFISEMNALLIEPDTRQAADALTLIGRLENPSAELIPGVTAAGRDIIARQRKFNASTPEQDPSYEGAADVAVRFSAWLSAVKALRDPSRGDFIPELREILELSRLRTDSQVMRSDVRRVASYYLKLWAGVEPLPDDPPPR